MKYITSILGGCLAALCGNFVHAAVVVQNAIPNSAESPDTNQPGIVVPAPKTGGKTSSDVLEFLNGDTLHGQFLSIDAKNGARFQHPAMKDPINVDLASIARIKLDQARTGTNSTPGQNCTVRLTNRDQLYGQLVSMNPEHIQLNTWYGGTLNIPRKNVEFIIPGNHSASVIYEGPTGMEGWKTKGGAFVVRPGGVVTRSGEAWTFNNNAFLGTGNGALGRSFELPQKINLEFDLGWTGYLQMAMTLLGDTPEGYGNGNGYLVQLTQGSIYLQRMSRAGDSSMLGNAEAPNLARKDHAHFSFRIDREKKTIALLIDGTLLKQWTEPANFFNGSNIVFHQQGQARLKLSGIKITAWDGKIDAPDSNETKTKEDLVKLANKDKISGTLKSIENGKMNFQTAFASLEIPLDRITEIQLAGEKTVRPPENPGEARLNFLGHGSVTCRVENWDENQITATSPVLGQIKLKPSAFGEIQFNLDQKKAESDDAAAMGAPGPEEVLDKD